MSSLPLLGAAMPLHVLESLRDWLIADQRDLELQDFTMPEVLNGDWMPLVEQARKLLDGYSGRLGIHGPFMGLNIANRDPEIRDVVSKRLLQGLAVCEALGANQMVIHSPFSSWDCNNFENFVGTRDEMFERTHLTLAAAVKRAESIGVTMVVENIEDKDPDLRCDLVDSFNSTALAISIDTGHAHYAHRSTGAPPSDFYVNRAGSRLQHVHIQDADGYADRHWRPGRGTICWQGVFMALARLPHSPRLILELKDHSQILPAVAYLNAEGWAR